MIRRQGFEFVTFKVKAYGDFALATEPEMTLQIVVGDDAAFLTATWTQTRRGWKLTQSNF
jgi:hypothetical protein